MKESKPDSERQGLIDAVTKDAARYLALDLLQNTPSEIVSSVDDTVKKIVFGEGVPIPDTEEPDLLLGCLWGAQMVREFEWAWVNIHQDGSLDVAVVSAAREMVIYPFTFVAACLAKQCICTVELSFNMLLARRDSLVFPAGTYEDIMTRIHHVVPPYTLERRS